MSDQVGLYVGRIFFSICALVCILGFIYVKKAVDIQYWYIKTFQFKNIKKKPDVNHYRYARIYFFLCFVFFLMLILNPLLMDSGIFIAVFFMIIFFSTAYFYLSLF